MSTTTSPATLVQPPSVDEVIRHRRPLRNVNKEAAAKITPLDKLALWITIHVGSMGFFIIIFAWTVIWLGWNSLAPAALQFDPPMAFVFWLFISNVIQILLMPLIMVGQNVQSDNAELRAEHDLEVNGKSRARDRSHPSPPGISKQHIACHGREARRHRRRGAASKQSIVVAARIALRPLDAV